MAPDRLRGFGAVGMLPSALRTYPTQHPAVVLMLLERLPAEQLAGLSAGRLDVGIGPPQPAADLESFRTTEEPLAAALPVGHRLASGAGINLPVRALTFRLQHYIVAR